MKEQPILFSGPMVRAILAGRKTQTRRVITPPPECAQEVAALAALGNGELGMTRCRTLGKVGERLWVKETFGINPDDGGAVYRATDPDWETCEGWKWKPSIFMPRLASRLTLEIVSVRVEQLQKIWQSRGDCIAEGAFLNHNDYWEYGIGVVGEETPQAAFRALWDTINFKRGFGWKTNPWVWVIEFKRCE